MKMLYMAIVIALTLWAASSALAADAETYATPRKGPQSWHFGPSTDPGYFPLGVWAQNTRDAREYAELGVNFYLSLPGGPNQQQLQQLKAAGLRTICHQNEFGLQNLENPVIMGWMHGDEPDNFTRDETDTKWVPKRSAEQIIADYKRIREKDPTRPVLLNLGQGVANDAWKGGWAKEEDYIELVKGCDIVSYDIYPMCSSRPEVAGKMELIGLGVERLRRWTNDEKIVWFIMEAAHINNAERMATPEEMRSEAWMAIIHGAKGIIYFCHQWQPTRDFAVPVHQPEVGKAVATINREITTLAPIVNSPTVEGRVEVTSSNPDVPIKTMVKSHEGDLYVFAVSMRSPGTVGSFQVEGLTGSGQAQVFAENRGLEVNGGRFTDDFSHYGVHIYRLPGAAR